MSILHTDIELLDSLDMALQLSELKDMKPGWMDGEGEIPDPADLDWFGILWDDYFQALVYPYLFPMEDGNIVLEWRIPDIALNLEVDLRNRRALLFYSDKKTNKYQSWKYDLRDAAMIRELVAVLRKYAEER